MGVKLGEDGRGARMGEQHDWICVLRQAACCGWGKTRHFVGGMRQLLIFLLVAGAAGVIAASGAAWAQAPASDVGVGPRAPVVVAPTVEEFEAELRLQIFLDGENFCPGVVDGRRGEFTRKAVAAWNVAHDIEDVDDMAAVGAAAEREVAVLYAAYTVKAGDLKYVAAGLPTKPEDQARVKYMGYRSMAEFVAERFHTTEGLLARLNPKTNLGGLKPDVVLRVPNVTPFEIEAVKPQRAWSEEPDLSRHSVLINVRHKTAAIYDVDGDLVAMFPITPGREKFVPYGEWTLRSMVSTPVFRWDKQLLEEGKHGAVAHQIPPGPNSPVGVLWAGTNRRGIGLHGTSTPETIGRSQSAGCIRFANWDAIRLPTLLRPGARVIVQ
jgi:lipoprotein-anchoring transpeptidase ErfK/SrfK